jgi:hypothetical protein
VLPAPAIADGTSQPWTPPAAAVPADDELGHCRVYGCERPTRMHLCDECLRDYGLAPVAESKSSGELANAHAERLRLTQRQCDAADRLIAGLGRRVGLGLELLAKGDRGGLEATLREALSMAGAGLADPQTGEPGAAGEGAEVERLTRERDEARRVGAEALTRAAELEADVARLTRERDQCLESVASYTARLSELRMRLDARAGGASPLPDREARRFELVKAAMRSGRDAYTAVRDADEALAKMSEVARADDAKDLETVRLALLDAQAELALGIHGSCDKALSAVRRGLGRCDRALARRRNSDESASVAFVPPSKGPSAKAVAVALQAIAWTPPYLDMAVKELTHVTAPDWDEAAHALECAALCVGEALRATGPFVTPSADTARGKARTAEREALVARLRGEA